MSTSATYLLSTEIGQMVCFYIPYNGNPQAAADYFYNMHQCNNVTNGFVSRFFEANFELAQKTFGHKVHSDTVYRYRLDQYGKLTAWHRMEPHSNIWEIFYIGHWQQFITIYHRAEIQF